MPRKYEHYSVDLGEIGTGLHVFAETRDLAITSAGRLLDKFNADKEPGEPMLSRPIGKALNPIYPNQTAPDGHSRIYQEDTWVYVFRNNFYVLVHKHIRTMSGPHVAKLMYKSWQTGQRFWIATVQIECMFFSENMMDVQIFNTVYNKLWFISDRSRKDKVTE